MPWYDYRCPDCETVFEVKRSFAQADQPAPCPECANPRTDKLLVRANVVGGKSESIPVPMSRPAAGGCGCGACGCGI